VAQSTRIQSSIAPQSSLGLLSRGSQVRVLPGARTPFGRSSRPAVRVRRPTRHMATDIVFVVMYLSWRICEMLRGFETGDVFENTVLSETLSAYARSPTGLRADGHLVQRGGCACSRMALGLRLSAPQHSSRNVGEQPASLRPSQLLVKRGRVGYFRFRRARGSRPAVRQWSLPKPA